MKILSVKKILISFCAFLLALSLKAEANNLQITNVQLKDRVYDTNNIADTAIVQFDITWDNSWRNATNHDAVWIILKPTFGGTYSGYHGLMKDSGLSPADTSAGSNNNLEVYVPSDKTGAFLRPKGTETGSMQSTGVRLKLDWQPSGGSANQTMAVTVIGIEMVFIPTGEFYAGDGRSASASLDQGSGDTDPWYITSEALILTSGSVSNMYRYRSGGATGENVTSASFTIPAAWPKGYAAFYCMKYEVTEGQYVDFIKNLTVDQLTNRDITSSAVSGKNSDSVINRNTVSITTSAPSSASTLRPDRAMTFMSWPDLCAYLDWAALRPMTELEFEKACRGAAQLPSASEYAWGGTAVSLAINITGSPEDGLETVGSTNNAHMSVSTTTTLAGGDTSQGSAYQFGPLRAGIFATSSTSRGQAGAGYYGVMEMSGNVVERAVSLGITTGRTYTGTHGDGLVSVTASNEGNADASTWPQPDATDTTDVTRAKGSGFRGGAWVGANTNAAVSDRSVNANNDANRATSTYGYGGRGVRTYDGP